MTEGFSVSDVESLAEALADDAWGAAPEWLRDMHRDRARVALSWVQEHDPAPSDVGTHPTPPGAGRTPRGFRMFTEFQHQDYRSTPEVEFTVQESSLATEWKVWVGAGDNRAHLSVEEARWVRDALTDFLDHSEAPSPLEEQESTSPVPVVSEDMVERAARALAGLEPGEVWPTNGVLGGSLTGTRDDEYRDGMREQARAVLVAALSGEEPK